MGCVDTFKWETFFQLRKAASSELILADSSRMGRIFLDHIGGTRLFSCASCDTILTNRTELISTRFTGATGRAFLFNKVVNLQYREVQDRLMLTGRHVVRDISCKNCNSKLGWIYEYATEDSQRYKEGRVILERALVRESEGFEEHAPSGISLQPSTPDNCSLVG
ncbi:protein yippee-like 5 isoform X1 [Osmerus mordax]|uniref:protein yippee-like 5 isoform X1 n=2 Tax=Osmerus TaxID=8013 RepID=UPI00350F9D23